jgi:hypothetical protein
VIAKLRLSKPRRPRKPKVKPESKVNLQVNFQNDQLELLSKLNPQPEPEEPILTNLQPEEISNPEPNPEPEENLLISESKPYSEAVALVLKLRGEPRPLSLDKIAIKLQNENYLNANGLLIWSKQRVNTIIQKDKKDNQNNDSLYLSNLEIY